MPKKIIYVITEDWYFLSHRLELAVAMKAAGWEVIIATKINSGAARHRLIELGLRIAELPVDRARLISLGDCRYFFQLVRLYRTERPTLVHQVAMKPALYGSLAALLVGGMGVVNAFGGMGHLFMQRRGLGWLLRLVVLNLFRRLFRSSRVRVILQNTEDFDLFARTLKIPLQNLRLIRGSGVDTKVFRPVVHGERTPPVIVMASRMLRDKGVLELAGAGRLLRNAGIPARIVLAGGTDPQNPSSLGEAELRQLAAEGDVEWLGHQSDMAAVYGGADIAVLPTSYGEGVPKTLLEAAACGLPIVATDIAGCREIVHPEENGILVPVRDPKSLAAALHRLLVDVRLRQRFGEASRRLAVEHFTSTLVLQKTRELYSELSADKEPSCY